MATATAPRFLTRTPRLPHPRFFQQHNTLHHHSTRYFHASPATMTKTVYFDCSWTGPDVTVDSNGKVTNIDKSGGDKGESLLLLVLLSCHVSGWTLLSPTLSVSCHMASLSRPTRPLEHHCWETSSSCLGFVGKRRWRSSLLPHPAPEKRHYGPMTATTHHSTCLDEHA